MNIGAVSEISRQVDRALWLLGGASVLLLAGVTITMIVFAVKYHRSRAKQTSQIQGNLWLEVTWIIIPTIIVTWMFFVGYRGFLFMRDVPEGAMVVQVTGRQWAWSFFYPEERINTSEMAVPVNVPVKVELTAPPEDVLHSFYLPEFRVKEDVLPGRDTYLWFEAERTGQYNIFCAEFCGQDHSKMITTLHVLSPEDYEAWVHGNIAKKYEPLVYEALLDAQHPRFAPDDLNVDGAALYGTFCASCHGVQGDGSGLPGVARDFRVAEDWKRSPKVTDIFRTLTDGIEGGRMRPYPNLTPWEKAALAHHVRSFLSTAAPPDTQEDFAALVTEYELDKLKGPKKAIPVEKAMDLILREASVDGQ